MAGHTGGKIHFLGVFFVALRAVRDLPVYLVALVAGQIRVGTGMCLHFISLLLVTRKTRAGNFTFHLEIKRRMGIRVAASALFQVVMGLPLVAHAALRYGICPLWRMLYMAVHTAHLGFVFLSARSYGFGLLGVTMDTLRV
jgi:hypothetical protein